MPSHIAERFIVLAVFGLACCALEAIGQYSSDQPPAAPAQLEPAAPAAPAGDLAAAEATTPVLMTFAKVTAAQKKGQTDMEKYLKQQGWVYNGDTPGGFFLWELEWKGKSYRMRADDALYVQSYIQLEKDQLELERKIAEQQLLEERERLQSSGVQ